MAKQQIRQYAFTPAVGSTKATIEIPGKWDLNQITIITNVTRNVILYNFADSTYFGTTVSFSRGNSSFFPTAIQNGDGTTIITIAVATVGQLSTDNLSIFVERLETWIRPWPAGTDGFERMRMAAPVSMLDADFEYGLQPTKWQTLSMVRSQPGIFEIPGSDYNLQTITTDASNAQGTDVASLITVTTVVPHYLTAGQPIVVTNIDPVIPGFARAQGELIVNSIINPNRFTYYAKAQVGTTSNQLISTPYSILRKGGFYSGTGQTPIYSVSGGSPTTFATITLTFASNHGYIPGDAFISAITSDNGVNNHSFVNGPFFISTVPTLTTLTFQARQWGVISGTPQGIVYSRCDSFFVHRPIDGGVSLGTGGPQYGAHSARMSKKYVRYQSGKSINYNTAALFAPNYDMRAVTATDTIIGSEIYITTDEFEHGLQAGATIQLNGMSGSSGYTGVYTVARVQDERTIIVTATNVLSSTAPQLTVPSFFSHVNWYGATVRAGTFDDQNGIYMQFDGTNMAVGVRNSVSALAGTLNVTLGSTLVTGNNSRFDFQLVAGDRIVIKGMTHVVTAVSSSTWMWVVPPWRGSTSTTVVKAAKTIDILVPQFNWNVDRCDGSNSVFNPSGYLLLPWRMQMIGMQWTWYGAGFIEWMLRGPDGNYIVIHRLKNSNNRSEAYMRSGNQPVRYEVMNEGQRTSIFLSMGPSDTSVLVNDLTWYANSGTVYVDNELIGYNGKSTSTGLGSLLNLQRSVPLRQYVCGALRSYTAGPAASHSAGTGLIPVGITASPTISHWGSAFLQDGGFDEDRGYIFSYQAPNVIASVVKRTAFAIRLAPSVSNAIIGDLGVRDLINRAQLLLTSIENTVGGGSGGQQAVVIEGVLNPANYPLNADKVQWFGLQGTVQNGNPLGSGQPSFTQVAPSGAVQFDGSATYITAVSSTVPAPANSNVIYVVSTASMQVGDAVTTTASPITGGTGLAGNTLIQSVGDGLIFITQPVLSQINTSTSLTFYRNQWAVPGETIFSFISSPANKDQLELGSLKELSNTPLGGRGTFPNGPDTLFINVYLTSGPPLQTNLVLRWNEAQA